MHTLSIDLETYSPVDLRSAGAYKYAEQVEILLIAYSLDGADAVCLDLTQDEMPNWLYDALTDPDYLKIAFNAAFERAVLNAYYRIYTPPEQWECTLVRSAMCGLPLSLDESSKALGLTEKKDNTGKTLIRYFCIPCKPTKTNGMRLRNYREDAPDKWQQFMEYCRQDVIVEQAIGKKLAWLKIPADEKELWCLDQRINERGVKIERQLVENAIEIDNEFRAERITEAVALTGLDNPNSVKQLKDWLETETEATIDTLNKASVTSLIGSVESGLARRVLQIRADLSKSSIKKYTAMINAAGTGDRIRGMFQYYGANRTGRFSGRLIQPQNLARISYNSADLDIVRSLVLDHDRPLLEMVFGPVQSDLSQLIRTALVPEKGKKFIIVDYSAVEAVILSWLAGEKWRLNVFNTHGKIYEASASQMFKVPITSVTKSSHYRQKSKIAELALGYAGGANALLKMGALDMGLTLPELQPLVDAWRSANPAIVSFWYDLERAAKYAIRSREKVVVAKGAYFKMAGTWLAFVMPSGRPLLYANCKLDDNGQITYMGMDQTTKKWTQLVTYSGKLAENYTQAFARDCLANGMLNIEAAGIKIVMHVHDEVVCEVPENSDVTVKDVEQLMTALTPWMKNLPLRAEGFESKYYQK